MPFDIELQSGSRYTVIDPTTNQPYNFYLSSLVSASNEVYYDAYPTYSTASIGWNPADLYGLSSMVWAEYLGKYITQTFNYAVFSSTDGFTWVPATQAFTGIFPDELYPYYKMAVGEELQIIASNGDPNFLTCSIFHSTDGDIWNTGSVSEAWAGFGMAYSPSLQRFVSVGRYGSPDREAGIAYSDDGISFTVISGSNLPSTSSLQYFSDVTWDSSGSGQFITIGFRGSVPYDTGSVYTSANGISWTFKTDINSELDPSGGNITFTKIASISGSYLILGRGGDSSSLLRSTDLINWTYVSASWTNSPSYFNELYDIAYSPTLNRTVIVGDIAYNLNDTPRVLVSDDTITWYTASRFSSLGYDNKLYNVAWSPTLNQFVGLAGDGSHVYRSNDGLHWLNDNQSYSASIGFEDTPPGTLLNTALSPWTGSATYLVEMENVYTYMTYTLLTTDFNDSYIPTSSYGIIIDSSSMMNFSIDDGSAPNNPGTGSFVEVEEVGGIRYIREISQPEGEEYEDTQYVTYRSNSLLSTLIVGATSSFSASLKSEGRNVRVDYFLDGTATKPAGYWTNSGLELYSTMELNLTNGEVISASAQPDENFVFLEQPRLTDKTNGYWELTFKAGFGRTLSGSVTIT
jgi:hypothetical protein